MVRNRQIGSFFGQFKSSLTLCLTSMFLRKSNRLESVPMYCSYSYFYMNHLVFCLCSLVAVYVFGLFTTDIFVNACQLVTGCLAPHFLSVCRPNYTALGCLDTQHFVSQSDVCTGDPDDITRARKTFPSKEAALSLYTAVYLAVSGSVSCDKQ